MEASNLKKIIECLENQPEKRENAQKEFLQNISRDQSLYPSVHDDFLVPLAALHAVSEELANQIREWPYEYRSATNDDILALKSQLRKLVIPWGGIVWFFPLCSPEESSQYLEKASGVKFEDRRSRNPSQVGINPGLLKDIKSLEEYMQWKFFPMRHPNLPALHELSHESQILTLPTKALFKQLISNAANIINVLGDAEVVMYYVGHGTATGGNWWIAKIAPEERKFSQKQLCNLHEITFEEVIQVLKQVKPQFNLTLICDCCHSGIWVEKLRQVVSTDPDIANLKLCIVAACQSTEFAYETELLTMLIQGKAPETSVQTPCMFKTPSHRSFTLEKGLELIDVLDFGRLTDIQLTYKRARTLTKVDGQEFQACIDVVKNWEDVSVTNSQSVTKFVSLTEEQLSKYTQQWAKSVRIDLQNPIKLNNNDRYVNVQVQIRDVSVANANIRFNDKIGKQNIRHALLRSLCRQQTYWVKREGNKIYFLLTGEPGAPRSNTTRPAEPELDVTRT